VKKAFRVLIPVAAALAVCFLFYFEPVAKTQPLAVPTQATATADWTGAVMDGELTKVSMELTSSMSDLSLSDTDLLIAQLEADFAAYAEN
jgi:organic hydroperoxide reductase OsmC/OhrA